MAADELVVHGAREHNLKDITVRLPRNALICITGLSGSGKSSLAFDTIYAEGQRRYVESLSAYARQFLQMMEKPDVDSIDGLSPAISIDQKTTSRNPRSTVGTVTEIYDYLRLLYARVGRPHCPVCGRPIAGQSIESIVEQILALPEGTRFTVNAPVVRDRKGEFRDLFEELRNEGFTRVKVDGEQHLLEEPPALDKKFKHTIEVVVDRLVMKDDLRTRLTPVGRDGGRRSPTGLVSVDLLETRRERAPTRSASPAPSTASRCPSSQPRIFSFNSPHGACPRCTGLGAQQEIDPDLLVPDPSLSINDGALVPWAVGNSSFYESVIQAIADRYEIDTDKPWQELDRARAGLLPLRHRRRQGLRHLPQPDGPPPRVHDRVRGDRRLARAPLPRDRQLERSASGSRSTCRSGPARPATGARLKPEVLAVTVGGRNIHEFTRLSVTAALAFLDELELSRDRGADRRRGSSRRSASG